MATPVIMPRQGQSVESCIITKWHKQEGDPVAEGDLLFTYETDKATFDEEAKVAGTMLKIFFPEGEDVPVLLNVCVIGNPGEDVSEFVPEGAEGEQAAPAPEASVPETASAAPAAPVAVPVATASADGGLKVSPRAKGLAQRLGVDPAFATATGPEGRVIARDVETLQAQGPRATRAAMAGLAGTDGSVVGTGIGGRVTTADLAAAAAAPAPVASPAASAVVQPDMDAVDVPLTNIRKVIARAMHASLSNSAQLTLNASFDATDVMAYRKRLKANAEKLGLPNITLNDIVLYAVSRTLADHPDCNAHYLDTGIRQFRRAHLGVAVDTERGLMVPTLFNADLKSLSQLSVDTKELVAQAQSGSIDPDKLQGATFTITNLGTLGVESFTPVLNPPQTCILGVNTVMERVRTVDGVVKTYPAMGLSLTFDHRALDGAPAARFMADLKNRLENFSLLLAK